MSSNLISRSTVNAFTKSFLLQLILDTHIGYLGSFLLYWKFSPDTYYVSGAWSVMSVGILDNDGGVYYNSYGRESPGTNGANYAWPVYPIGSVSLGTFTDVNNSSYGCEDRRTRTSPTTVALRGMLILLAVFTTTASMSTFPTGVNRRSRTTTIARGT